MERTLIAQGNTAEIYQYGEGKILKLFRKEMPLFPIEKEYRIAGTVQKHLTNVPKVYDLIKEEERTGIVYEEIRGRDMIANFLGNPFALTKNSKHLAQIHVTVHEKDIAVEDTVKEKLSFDIANVKELTREEKEGILAYMKKLPDGRKLCHFDYHPGNIMMRGQEAVVIDWMTACTGDPAADVARTRLLMQRGEMIHISVLMRTLLKLIMKKIGKEYEKEYCRLTGMTDEEISKWIMPVAAARLTEWLTEHERKGLVELVREQLHNLER